MTSNHSQEKTMPNDDAPDTECPQCRAVTQDLDGFGTVYCSGCGYCAHVSRSGRDGNWVCNACDKVLGPLIPAIVRANCGDMAAKVRAA